MKKLILMMILILTFFGVAGQTEKQLLPSDLKQSTIVTEPVTLNKGWFRSGLALSYGVVDKYFDAKGKKNYFLNSAWGSTYTYLLTFQYGVSNRFMLDIGVPVSNTHYEYDYLVRAPEINMDKSYATNLKGRGIGDGYLTATYQIIPERENNLSVIGAVDITFPTGEKNPTSIKSITDYKLPSGNGYFVAGARFSVRKVSYPFSFILYSGYSYKMPGTRLINATDTKETDFKDGNRLDAGGSFNFLLNEWIAMTNELNYYYRAEGEIKYSSPQKIDPAWAFSYETRLVFQVKKFRIGEAVRVPLKGKSVSADPLYVMLVQYIF